MSIHTSTSLQIMGLKGETIADDRVWITKTHHPYKFMDTVSYSSNKTIFCVRNPLDVLPSYCSMFNTLNHATKPPFDLSKDYPETWNWFVKKQCGYMKRFFATLIRQFQKEKVNPIYIVRYEDLVQSPRETLKGLFEFLLEDEDLEGSNAVRRIEQVLSKGKSATVTYSLKSTTGKFNYNRGMYSDELYNLLKEELSEMIHYFGYAKVEHEDNFTGFFEYENQTEEQLANYYQFRRDNQENMKEILDPKRVVKTFVHNETETFDVLDEEDFANTCVPAREYARKTIEAKVKEQETTGKSAAQTEEERKE